VAEVLSATLLNDSRPMVLYRSNASSARVVTCTNVICGAFPAPQTVVSVPADAGSITVGSDGLPFIFGITNTGPERFITKCGAVDCTGTAAYAPRFTGLSDVAGTVAVARTVREHPYLVSTASNAVQIQVCENRNCDSNGRR
jgi:hypothetical protein